MKYFTRVKNNFFHRTVRISQELKKELSIILNTCIHDPRINFIITISMVKLSRDLSHAKIFFSHLDNHHDLNNINHLHIKKVIIILKGTSSYIRKKLSQKMNLRKIPLLSFYYDYSLLEGIKISNLLKNM